MKALWEDVRKSIFVWRVPQATPDEIAQADAVVTAAHGLLRNGTPSPGDWTLADFTRRIHREFPHKPIIPQEPVAYAALEIRFIAVAHPPRNNPSGKSNLEWNSRAVARFQARVCRDIFIHKDSITVALIATPWSQPRMKWELERQGLNVVVVPVPPFTADAYNHPHSIFWSGRGKTWRSLLVEAFRGRLHYLLYWLGV